MKKRIFPVLALLLLVLAGCGKDDIYSDLVAHVKGDNLYAIEQELAALSPSFARKQAELAEKEALLDKYYPLLQALEQEQFDTAIAHIELLRPAPTEPEYESVEITLDNWTEFFELVEGRFIRNDEFREPATVGFGYCIVLKEEYEDRLADQGLQNIVFKMEYDLNLRRTSGDITGDAYSVGGITFPQGRHANTATVRFYSPEERTALDESTPLCNRYGVLFASMMPPDGNRTEFNFCENGEVTAVQGTLLLKKP